MKNFRLGQDEYDAGGYSELNDANSMVIYNYLNTFGLKHVVQTWEYINATIHEIGHGLFGFKHAPKTGYTNDPSSIMDYRSAYRKGAGFNSLQQVIIMESKWGKIGAIK